MRTPFVSFNRAETAILTVKQAAQGKVGRLSIRFIGSATLSFLPDLIRRYKLEYPNVKLALHDLYPVEPDKAWDRGEIDIAITRSLSLERSKNLQSRVLLRDPLVAVLPRSRKLKSKRFGLPTLRMNHSYFFTEKEHLGFSTQSLEPVDLKVFLRGLRTSRIRCRRSSGWLRRRKA
jgi:DNA-binding transcriptional LysR family regulator